MTLGSISCFGNRSI